MNRSTRPSVPIVPGRHALLSVVFILAAIWVAPAQASQLVPQNLKQMIDAADMVVTGKVSKVTDGIDNGIPFTEVTMHVDSSIKREVAANGNYSFRQYGLLKALHSSSSSAGMIAFSASS